MHEEIKKMSKHIEVYPVERARERSLYICNQFEKTAKFREAIEYINEKIEYSASKGMFATSIQCSEYDIIGHPVKLFADLPTSSMDTLIAYLEGHGYRAWKTSSQVLYITWYPPEGDVTND